MYLQLIFNSVIAGLLLSLVAVGFNLIFNTTKIFHLAHGALYVSGGYILIHCLQFSGCVTLTTWFISLLFSLCIVACISIATYILVYRPLIKKGAAEVITLVVSMAVYTFLINCLAVFFGNETRFLNADLGPSFLLGNVVIVPIQAIQFLVSILLLLLLFFSLKTKLFFQIKAVMSNATVASLIGVNVDVIRIVTISIGSVLAAVSAILRLYDVGISPYAGIGVTLTAAVSTIVGGQRSIWGTVFISLVISSLQTFAEFYFSSQWKESITFSILILAILWRTEGSLSFKTQPEAN
jgi:branched-chain amino acid transport system permease protein